MLISDGFTVPYESLVDLLAILVGIVVYAAWCMMTFATRRRFVAATSMRVLAAVATALLLVSGLFLYSFVVLKLDAVGYKTAVLAALPESPLTPRAAELLEELVSQRALSLIIAPQSAGMRGLVFVISPGIAILVAAAVARRRPRVAAV